ncbi:hypothetical protein [Undibacterium sp. Ren11W]|uniref:hypothetical protein n=1 Tax=Undibacterium sp. Ren11W TaxID=3413045 RepID=UPI003BEFA81C
MSGISKKNSSSVPGLILDVRAPSNGASGGATMLFATVDNTQELAAYAANYSAATGIYTVPVGGHKNVRIVCNLTMSIPANNGTVNASIMVNGVARSLTTNPTASALAAFSARFDLNLKNLVVGDLIKITTSNVTTSSVGVAADFMQIFAS